MSVTGARAVSADADGGSSPVTATGYVTDFTAGPGLRILVPRASAHAALAQSARASHS